MYSRTIKVGDLLTKPGSSDIVTWSHQSIETLSNITQDGLDITFKLHSVNHNELRITIIGLKAQFHETCDYSGVEFIRTLIINQEDNEIMRFGINPDDDEIYPIHSRDNTINLLDPVTQLINIYEPVSKVAPGYEFQDEGNNDINGNHIIFK